MNLNQGELKSIFEDSQKLLSQEGIKSIDLADLPESILGLQPLHVQDQAGSLWIYLETCSFDSKVVLMIDVDKSLGERIRLQYGDPMSKKSDSVILWKNA